jgi:hypothetical protein
MRITSLALLAACSGAPSESTGGTDSVPLWSQNGTDPTTDTDTTTVPPDGDYHGTIPDSPLPPPTFAAVTNRDGSPRTPADLVGHPTVMWFYPAAGTGG